MVSATMALRQRHNRVRIGAGPRASTERARGFESEHYPFIVTMSLQAHDIVAQSCHGFFGGGCAGQIARKGHDRGRAQDSTGAEARAAPAGSARVSGSAHKTTIKS